MTRSYIYYNLVERRLLEKYALAAPEKLIYTRNKDPTGRFKGMFEEGERKGRRAIDPKLLAEIKQSSLQDLSTQLLALLDTVKDKKVLLHGVQLAMDELKKSQVRVQLKWEVRNTQWRIGIAMPNKREIMTRESIDSSPGLHRVNAAIVLYTFHP